MKTAVLWVLPILAVSSIGSITFATSHPRLLHSPKNHDSKVVPFKYDNEVEKYLISVSSYMLVPPRDGIFGAMRVPTFHGKNISTVPGYDTIKSINKDISIASFVVGRLPESTVQAYAEYKQANPKQKIEVPEFRVTRIHALYKNAMNPESRNYLSQELHPIVENAQKTALAKGYDTFSQGINVGGVSGYIMAKAIRASDKSCYGCHATIKPGEPIGYVMAAIWNKAP